MGETQEAAMYDLVIRGGTCFDGLGSPPVTADVAIVGDRIVEVGRVSGIARRTVDADGLYVAPGFVDAHTHLDAQIFWDPHGASLTGQGVTSAVMGNCGFTLAPSGPERSGLVVRALERAEEMSAEAIRLGVPWTWTSFAEYLDAVDALPKALNLGALVGHSAVRIAAMGERAFTDEATDEEFTRMELAVRAAMDTGSLGFSTSRSWTHTTMDGSPVPSRLASWAEVSRLVMAMAESGTGTFQFAPERPADAGELADFRERLSALAVASGRPMLFLVGGQEEQLATLDAVKSAGGTAIGQVHVRGYEAIFSFKTSLPFDALPTWQRVRAEPLDVQATRLRDPELRRRLCDEAMQNSGGARFDEITVVDGSEPEPSIARLAQDRGTSPVDVIIDLSLDSDFAQVFRMPLLSVSDAEVLASFRHPSTVIAASDAGAHVSRSADSNIPTYLLAHWVRDREILRWEEAIKMLTSIPAEVWGLEGRGSLQTGAHADLVVFDPETVGCGIPEVVNALPDGGPCIQQSASGIQTTVVNGVPVIDEGQPANARPGRLLRSAHARKPPRS